MRVLHLVNGGIAAASYDLVSFVAASTAASHEIRAPSSRRTGGFAAVWPRADVVHAHDADAAAAGASMATRRSCPLVVSLSGVSSAQITPALTAALRDAATIVVESEADRDGLRRVGLDPARVAVVGHPVVFDGPPASDSVPMWEIGRRAAEIEEIYRRALAGESPPPPAPPPARWPTVTVVIPSYDRRDLLVRALDALDRQTYPPDRVDVVVVDNGSTDGTADAVAARAGALRVTLLRHESVTSAAEARNTAVAEATGEIVAFTDSDCRPAPTWLAALVASMVDGVAIVQGRTTSDPAQPVGPLDRSQWVPSEYGLYETCNIAYRRAVLEALGPVVFRPTIPDRLRAVVGARLSFQPFGEDTDLAWRVKRRGGRSRFCSTAVVHHHVFAGSAGSVARRSMLVAGFPVLVAEVPELRSSFLHRRVFLSRRRPRFWLAVACVVAARRAGPLVLVASVPYLASLFRLRERGVAARLARAPVDAGRDVVESVALVYGSARARRVVL